MAPAPWAALLQGYSAELLQLQSRNLNTTNPVTVSDYLAAQWVNPADILSILLLLGPDIVQGAVAQLAGRTITPVAFSFGWVAYAARALLNAVGDGSLMPNTDMTNTLVIGARSGHIRTTKTWVLGRLLRDGDDRVDEEMEGREQAHVPPGTTGLKPTEAAKDKGKDKEWEALRVSVYQLVPQAEQGTAHGTPTVDWVWLSGYVMILVQLCISIIPWIISNEWGTFMIAVCGNLLALVEGSLPQWRLEKWAAGPRTGSATVTITQGNGSRHAMLILGTKGEGLDLEILALGTRTKSAGRLTRISTAVLALLWLALLGTVAGLKTDTWYLMGIGLLGSVQNVIAAGAPRKPSAMGFHIRLIETISNRKVAAVLKEVESKYEFVGTSLVPVFFPGGLRVKSEEDIEFWRKAQDKRMNPNNWGTRIDRIPEKVEEQLDEKDTIHFVTKEVRGETS